MHERCLKTWCHRSGRSTCPVCRASLARNRAWVKIQVKGSEPAAEEGKEKAGDSKTRKPKKRAETEATVASTSGTPFNGVPTTMDIDEVEDDTENPAKQLNYLPAEELEAILDTPLQGASLGTKLDAIVKHVKLLRKRHQKAIEEYDEAMSARNARGHPTAHAEAPPTEAKVLIYSAWQYACDVLAAAFRREQIGHVRLEGGGKKEKAPIEFRENPDCAVFILHAKSQAAGLVSS